MSARVVEIFTTALVLLIVILAGSLWAGWNLSLDARWQPTGSETIARSLTLLNIAPGDLVYDLGCGDGRWLTRIVSEYDGKAIGVEIDPGRVLISWLRIVLAGAYPRAKVKWGNMYETDLSGADGVILFLSGEANRKLGPKLRQELDPGARVVSYYHQLPGWTPLETETNPEGHSIYLYER